MTESLTKEHTTLCTEGVVVGQTQVLLLMIMMGLLLLRIGAQGVDLSLIFESTTRDLVR